MSKKLTVAVIFGGVSSEYPISCKSAANVINILDTSKYNVVKLAISESGEWFLVSADTGSIAKGEWQQSAVPAVISPDAKTHGILVEGEKSIYVDVAFPILHGKNGEDGAIAALLKLAGIPQVTTTMTSGACSMDKVITKIICERSDIRTADFEFFYNYDLIKDTKPAVELIESRFDYPVFVKPSSAGSSVGVTKCTDRESLVAGLLEAAKHDFKVLVEECIVGYEVEAAVLGNSELFCPVCGQIAPAEDFYSFDAKYNNPESLLYIPAKISDDCHKRVIESAKQVYRAMECQGMARVDFFVTDDEQIIFNELNTIPGFTDISMYPKMMAHGGLDGSKLADKLIELAVAEDRI